MASASRTAQFAKVFKILKKCYKPVSSDPSRPVLEHLLLACCLEDAPYEAADEVFAALSHTFFDWNEVRVTSLTELSEVMARLPDPRTAASRVKRVLQAVFEETYSFDLEEHRKKNLGPTVKWLSKLDGATNFTVSYVVQAALGGHAIAIDSGTMAVLQIVGLVSKKDVEQGVVPGLERAIAKSKGVEFGSLLHQLGADYTANPYSPSVRKILLQIEPECKDRLPQRRVRKPLEEQTADPPAVRPAEIEPAPPVKEEAESAAKRSHGKKPSEEAKEQPSATEIKSPPAKSQKTASSKLPTSLSESEPQKKKSAAEGLSKRKPR